MENVVLVIHLILALCLIGVVLLQRSEGGGLGMGSGGGAISARGAATALGKLTWILAIGFIITSIALTVLAARNSAGSSVVDTISTEAPAKPETQIPPVPSEKDLLPPGAGDSTQSQPQSQPRAD